MVSSILGLWSVLLLVSGHAGSVRDGLPLVAWAIIYKSWVGHSYKFTIVPAHLVGSTQFRSKVLWLGALPGFERWPVQAL